MSYHGAPQLAPALGHLADCEPVPSINSGQDVLRAWIQRRHRGVSHESLIAGNTTVFETLNGLYIWDRCWSPRTICTLTLASGRKLQLPRQQTSNATLMPGSYIVLLGPAAAVGANTRTSMATLLEEHLNMPVLTSAGEAPGRKFTWASHGRC